MARCSCGNQTCSCIVQAVPDSGITVVGNGSATRPYLIGQDSSGNPLANLRVTDSATVDLSLTPQGGSSPVYNLQADALVSMGELTDVQDAPAANGQVLVWRTDHWASETPVTGSPPSGVWGTAPLTTAVFGTDSLTGREVYVDSAGKLRGKPEQIDGSIAAHPVTGLATTYPSGTSIMYVSGADGATWPSAGACLVVTSKHTNHAATQRCHTAGAGLTKAWVRYGTSTQWYPWEQVAGDTGNISDATGIFTPNATNFTLVSFGARVRNGVAEVLVRGTMKVVSTTPTTTGDISDIPLGTISGILASSTGSPVGLTAAHAGRGLFATINSGSLTITNINGTAALTVGETVTLSGNWLI